VPSAEAGAAPGAAFGVPGGVAPTSVDRPEPGRDIEATGRGRVRLALPRFRSARPGRASTDVVDYVRSEVLGGHLAPGDRLPAERDLAQQMGVSRVTVRDAVRSLEAAGLVEVRVGAHGGPFVTHPPLDVLAESLGLHLRLQGTTFMELAEVRLALEVCAVRLACSRANPEDIAGLRRLAEGTTWGLAASETARQSMDFHVAMVQSAHNTALEALFMATRLLIQDAFDLLHQREPDMVEVARDVHCQLASLVESGDWEAAVELMREHQYDFMRRAERALLVGIPERNSPEVDGAADTTGGER